MPIARKDILDRLRGMIGAAAIIGGGAALAFGKCEEAGGIDISVLHSRYRMDGRGLAAGVLDYGNANEIVVELARVGCGRWSTARPSCGV